MMSKLLNTEKIQHNLVASLDEASSLEDDNRIDWERKRLKRQQARKPEQRDYVHDDDALLDAVTPDKQEKRGKKDHRKKRRRYVYDEDRGHVVVKRRRRRGGEDELFEDGWDV